MKKVLIPVGLHHIKKLPIKRFLTIKEAASLLEVTPLTLRNWDKAGKIRAFRHPINNYRLYKQEDIELFLRKIQSSKKKIHLG